MDKKEGRGNKDFKRGGGASWVKGLLPYKRGVWSPLTNYGLSIFSSWHLSGCFLGIWSWNFSECCHGARKPYEVVHGSLIFLEKLFCSKNSFFLIWKNWSQFSMNLFYNENVYCYLLFSCTNPIFGKNLVPEV